ncbi:protein kinase family protein [Streptomyces marincola]|uniref:serine/threonine protein kinase n=1 Tax=Streptomyces marincola TaxID=2878388 RepID=UPI001CF56D17|nr:serine/threonine protein kinase [Streptomyces marincola]UCM89926.1 serine/threonine protein kinase [Streptomyces marincola]
MDSYAGRLLAHRYRLPRTPSDEFELIESRAFDTASGQEVLVRQVPLPEVVEAETLDDDGRGPRPPARGAEDVATRTPDDPVVRRAVEAAVAAAGVPDHPRLDQVFDVFVQGDGLWIVSELVPARPLAAVLAEERLGPFRAAEIAADLLAALRIVHAHGWTHRNVTARTVMICEDGRAVLTGLAAGAAEEALCGYDPLPAETQDAFAAQPQPQPQPAPAPPPVVADPAARPPAHAQGPARQERHDPGAHGPHGRGAESAPPAPGRALPPGFEGQPLGPEAYRRWETGALPRVEITGAEGPPTAGGGAAGFVARVREQGGLPQGPLGPQGRQAPGPYGTGPGPQAAPGAQPGRGQGERLPATWDFEGGAGREATPPQPGAPARGARSGAIAAYRAGTQAGAARRTGPEPAPGPADLPGGGRAAHPVRTGWEPVPPRAAEQPREPAPREAPAPLPSGRQPAGAIPGPPVRYRGPDTALAAERARQARIMTVGAVTERWAPEQAGPVYEHWRLAPPVGPAADFWALGALLFRAVQGHPPYPEENAAELAQAVCAEQPAFAEDCGALRPVIESLLRQDPTERPRGEELRGWLRSLLRSAPEPEVGRNTVTAPPALEPGRPADPRRLPILRRRGELVGPRRRPRRSGGPRRLGRALLVVVLLGLAGAVASVLAFMSEDRTTGGAAPPVPESGEPEPGGPTAGAPPPDEPAPRPTGDATRPSPAEGDQQLAPPPEGYEVREDESGFALTVPQDWERRGENAEGQVIFAGEGLELVVVAGRDRVGEFADDPLDYQMGEEPELAGYRAYQFRSAEDLYETRVGDVLGAEGVFAWRDAQGDRVAFNRVVLIDGGYHVVQVRGPADQRERLGDVYEVASESYRAG